MTFLVTEFGKPFTSAGFGNWFRDRCNEAGLPQCSAHGLRKLAATRLANAGCSADQIKAITGHESLSEVVRYTKAADQARLARQAIGMMRADREQKLSSNPNRAGQNGEQVIVTQRDKFRDGDPGWSAASLKSQEVTVANHPPGRN